MKVRRDLVRVSFLYYEDCPSHDLALERLREVMAEEDTPGRSGSRQGRGGEWWQT